MTKAKGTNLCIDFVCRLRRKIGMWWIDLFIILKVIYCLNVGLIWSIYGSQLGKLKTVSSQHELNIETCVVSSFFRTLKSMVLQYLLWVLPHFLNHGFRSYWIVRNSAEFFALSTLRFIYCVLRAVYSSWWLADKASFMSIKSYPFLTQNCLECNR